jgi:hypothetical protein
MAKKVRHFTREELSAVRKVREEVADREDLIASIRRADPSAFDELLRLLDQVGAGNVLAWAKAGQEKSGSVVRLAAGVE